MYPTDTIPEKVEPVDADEAQEMEAVLTAVLEAPAPAKAPSEEVPVVPTASRTSEGLGSEVLIRELSAQEVTGVTLAWLSLDSKEGTLRAFDRRAAGALEEARAGGLSSIALDEGVRVHLSPTMLEETKGQKNDVVRIVVENVEDFVSVGVFEDLDSLWHVAATPGDATSNLSLLLTAKEVIEGRA